MAKDRVMLGIVLGPQGVRGRVRVKSFTERPAAIAEYGPLSDERGTRRFALRAVGVTRGAVLAEIEGVADRNAAENLRGLRLYAERTALPAIGVREFYHADLIGMRVQQRDGAMLGSVKAIHDFGAGPLIEVALAGSGRTTMLAFNDTMVPRIDVEGGLMVVDLPAELLDLESRPDNAAEGGNDSVGDTGATRAQGA